MLLCLLVVYLLGTLQLTAILHVNLVKGLFLGVIPFIPLDLAKLVVAALAGRQVRRALRQAGFLVSREARRES